jgi:thioester reductase-like protein
MGEHLFLTGGTGFIGSRLLNLWLGRTEARITLLVHNHQGISAEQQRHRLLAALPGESHRVRAERLHCVCGDLAAPHLGLSREDQDDITDTATHIVHAGASLRFDLTLDQARQTNTAGTAAVIDLARSCPRLALFAYLGTAYVAGRCKGIVYEETEHDGLEHNNAYERSKYEAEMLVREAMSEIPATVLRPSIVTCDTATGYTPATSAFYRILLGIASGVLEVLPGRADTRLDMVPVDYVVEAAFAIGRRSELAGRCFHLCAGADKLISLEKLRDLSCRSFGRRNLDILSRQEFSAWATAARRVNPDKGVFIDEISLYTPYLYQSPIFDNANTRQALNGTGIRFRPVPEYFDMVADYVRRSLTTATTREEKPDG